MTNHLFIFSIYWRVQQRLQCRQWT